MALPTREELEEMRRQDFMREQMERIKREREVEEERRNPFRKPDNYNNDPRIWGCR